MRTAIHVSVAKLPKIDLATFGYRDVGKAIGVSGQAVQAAERRIFRKLRLQSMSLSLIQGSKYRYTIPRGGKRP